jgi:hypothetical protein
MQWFSVDELGHTRLHVLFNRCAHAEEDEGKHVRPTLLCPAYYGSLESLLYLLHKAIGGRMESRCAGQMDAANLARAWKSCDSNCRPWSVVMVCGHL